MRPKLTIGMAAFDSYRDVWFVVQALRLYFDLRQVELIVVDNKPDAPTSKVLKAKLENWFRPHNAGVRYIPMGDVVGTSAPRERIFREAAGEIVLCIDSHVLLAPESIPKLIAWFDAHPEFRGLVQGPLLLDHMAGVHTHFIDMWREEMWGVWGSAWKTCDEGSRVNVIQTPGGTCQFLSLDNVPLTSSAPCGIEFPQNLPYSGHEQYLLSLGMRPLGLDPADEFEIPGQGLGLFACRQDAWPGFNEHFRGFGGEEMYVHEKFRQRGDQCLCLGFLKWVHKFNDGEEPIKYPLTLWNKVRNYVLGHVELGLPLDRVREHFVGSGRLSAEHFEYLAADPVAHVNPPAPKQPETLEEIFDAVRPPLARPRDLDQHMPRMREMASECESVTEFSHRRESLVAWAAGRPAKLVSHNSELHDALVKRLPLAEGWAVDPSDSPAIDAIDETDLLFLDRVHTKARILEELTKYAPQVRRWIVLHDTVSHAHKGEDDGPGIFAALQEWLPESGWFVSYHTSDQYGLTVLARQERDRPAETIHLWPPGFGPGTELKKILAALGIQPGPQCTCNARAAQMDAWGVEGCRARRDEIAQWMRDGQGQWGWKDRLAAATKAVQTGLAFRLNPLDPFPGLIDEAIRRAESAEEDARLAA
jgi:hypothetical protein